MIHETIVTTRSEDATVHIAPMGIREHQEFVLLAPFRPSRTLDNLHRDGVAVVNFCDDVRIFAGCLTDRRDWPTVPASDIQGVVLEAALGHQELRVERFEDDPVRPRFFCSRVLEASQGPFRGFNRAQAAVIEAAILVSRLDMLPPQKVEEEVAYLRIAVEKTAGPREHEAWGWLMERLEAHHYRWPSRHGEG